MTIHDATFFTQPDVHTSVKGPFFRSAIKTALHRAARCIVPSKATRDELIRVLDADPTRIDVAYHGVDQKTFHVPTDTERQLVQARLGLRGHAVRRLPRHAGAAQERAVAGARLGEGRAGPARAAGAGAGRRVRLGRRDRPGHHRGAEPPAGAAAGLPEVLRPARVPRRRDRRRLPVARRGLRPAGAGGDGLRRRGADHAAAVAARGRRRRGGLHRGRPRLDRDRAGRAAGRPGAAAAARRGGGRAGRPSSPGRPAPRRTWPRTPAPPACPG